MGYTNNQRATFALLVLGSTAAVYAMVASDVGDVWIVLYAALLPIAFRLLILASAQAEPTRMWRSAQVWRAMGRHEIVLHYQPKVTLPAGKLTGVEALARWAHPRKGLLAPAAWLDATEHRWLEQRFCVYVLRAAVRQAAAWHAAGRDIVVSVNISPCCFVRRAFPQVVARTLAEHDLPSSLLCIELTEDALVMSEQSVQVARDLTELGVILALDDFGVGHSSMDRLVGLPLDELKIDRRFVSRMVASDRNEAVVRAAVGLAHSLGMVVVAEGVESDETLRSLESLGCDVAQGFLFSPALAGEELEAWIATDRRGRLVPQLTR